MSSTKPNQMHNKTGNVVIPKKRIEILLKLADKGHLESKKELETINDLDTVFVLGNYYKDCKNENKDCKKCYEKFELESIRWYEKASEISIKENGKPNCCALLEIGKCHESKKKYKTAIKYFRKASDLGCNVGQYILGSFYESGVAGSVDYKEAYKLYLKSAYKNNCCALYSLGKFHEYGIEVTKSNDIAFMYYSLSFSHNCALSQYALGKFYENGTIVCKNIDKAIELYELSAEQGYSNAQCTLGKLIF